MENFKEKNSHRIVISSNKYNVEKVTINEQPISFEISADDAFFYVENGKRCDLKIYALPKFFYKKTSLKLLLLLVDNLFTGGGYNRKEIEKQLTGIVLSGRIDIKEDTTLLLDENIVNGLSYEAYFSKRLRRALKLCFDLPMISCILVTVVFIVWALFKILF